MKVRVGISVLVVSLLATITGSAFLLHARKSRLINDTRSKRETTENPCFFLQPPETIDASPELSSAFKSRMMRETRGYPHEIPLAEAIKSFNLEVDCYPFWSTLPQLTEKEVIAAIIGGPEYGGERAWQKHAQSTKDIAQKGMMPKGSLLVAESGGCESAKPGGSQTCAKGLKIYLFLGLDKNPRSANALTPDQVLLIRKTYFDTEAK